MAVPEFQSFMLPVLKLFSDNFEHSTKECINEVIDYFKLSDEEVKMLVPSGKQTLVSNRVYWALTYLKKSLLLETQKRGVYKITDRGRKLLNTNPSRIDKKLLSKYAEYRIFSNMEDKLEEKEDNQIDDITPEENIDKIYEKINDRLADELLEIIMDKDSYYFENLVMNLFTKMGYGDQKANPNIVTKRTNDGGIDGIINQDKLGLDKIYVQAKRWKSDEIVGRTEIQKFVGALSIKDSKKGIFISTSDFTKGAREFVENLPIRLINGKELVKLMIEYNVGVQTSYTYEIKTVDNDYFEIV